MAGDGWRRARVGGAILIACCSILPAGCTGAASRPTSPPPPATSSVVPAGVVTVEADARPATLYVPERAAGQPSALVVVLHGYTGQASTAVEFFGLRALADQRGFAILAPQGTTDSDGNTFWNASTACCNFRGSSVDDSGYLSRLIAKVVATQGLDPARVFMVGHSNGGFMAHRFACEHADQVAAVASLAGALDAGARCAPTRPVSVLQVHGTADDTISYRGGEIAGQSYTSAAQTVALWRRVDRCTRDARPGPRLDADADVAGEELRRATWTGCRGGAEVALWTITGGTHVPRLTPAFTGALVDWLEAQAPGR